MRVGSIKTFVLTIAVIAIHLSQPGVCYDVPTMSDQLMFDNLAFLSMASYCKLSTLNTWNCGAPCAQGP